ncbi:dienelactone hydrolase family protein [Terricaulis silvestris]|uniref:Carboxymethylenebutenolidase n=1 Tax=Terricaulis silvestris TaxID=2686094 RepID=A0A6I6MU93_9CAUL|nr:dienelactone hydrolase family protein [Terricaulis silvestris]QGZ97026.1 Carboxymethylenebutenolidase [Terricaulis silvestris]
MGDWVEVQGPDGSFKAYVARPSGTPKGVVVAVQEIFGVNAVMRGKADWLAREGFLAIAPDLFWRIKPGIELTDQTDEEWKQAIDHMNALDKNASVTDVAATLAHARGMGVSKAGVMGYCMGGYIAFLAACRTDTDATVCYHGGGIHTALGEAGGIKKPVMLHNPMKDAFIPVEVLNQIRETLAPNPLVTVHEYAEQDHAFTREGGKHYDAAATELANSRTIAFFNQYLA